MASPEEENKSAAPALHAGRERLRKARYAEISQTLILSVILSVPKSATSADGPMVTKKVILIFCFSLCADDVSPKRREL